MMSTETLGESAGARPLSPAASTNMRTFPESTFFTEQRASALPSPAEIRTINTQSGDPCATRFNRPPPVIIPSLGLFVKYGADVTVAEAETQIWLRDRLQGQVPIPEVFGWAEDSEQRFIYMQLVEEGDTLMARLGGMSESERQAICKELRAMVYVWRALPSDSHDSYIGKSLYCNSNTQAY